MYVFDVKFRYFDTMNFSVLKFNIDSSVSESGSTCSLSVFQMPNSYTCQTREQLQTII